MGMTTKEELPPQQVSRYPTGTVRTANPKRASSSPKKENSMEGEEGTWLTGSFPGEAEVFTQHPDPVPSASARIVHTATDISYLGLCTAVEGKVLFYDHGPCPSFLLLPQDQELGRQQGTFVPPMREAEMIQIQS